MDIPFGCSTCIGHCFTDSQFSSDQSSNGESGWFLKIWIVKNPDHLGWIAENKKLKIRGV